MPGPLSTPEGGYALVDAALVQVLAKIRVHRKVERVGTMVAFSRVSAEDVLAPRDVPEFPTAHWDGYAVNSSDLSGASEATPVELKIVGTGGPGSRAKAEIAGGEAYQVATGAGLPSGADSIVPRESVVVRGGRVIVKEPSRPGSHIYESGEDLRKGEAVVKRGRVVRAQDVGELISLGHHHIKVWKKPKVSVLATGSELVGVDRPRIGKVVNSHSPVFLRLCESFGCTPVDMGISKDDGAEISRKLRGALAKSDLVLTLGGTSMGEKDYVTDVIRSMRPDVLVHRLKMDRGRVAGIAVVRGKAIVMLPGPIQGAMNAFLLLAVPVIEALSGTEDRQFEVLCTFRGRWEARSRYADFRKVVYVRLERGNEMTASPLMAETESMKVLAEADGCIVVPENVSRIESGERVAVRVVPGFSFA